MRGRYFGSVLFLTAFFFAAQANASFRGLAAYAEEAVARGEMTRRDEAMALLKALREPGKLNPPLAEKLNAPPDKNHAGDRCLTLDMLRIRSGLKHMDYATRKEAERLLGDAENTGVFKTGPIQSSTPVFAKTSNQVLTYQASTNNFAFEWGSALTDLDGSTPAKDENNNTLPDVIEVWATCFEYSLFYMKMMGFTDTPALDTYKIRILVANSDPNTTVDDMPSGYYGMTNGTVPYLPGTPPAYIVVSNNFLNIENANPNDLSATSEQWGMWGAMMVTAAHELFHLVQFMYAPTQWADDTTLDADSWWLEASSTWMEDEVFPYVNDYKQYFKHGYGWQYYPYMTLAVNANRSYDNQYVRISRTYGSAIFAKYLAEHMGGPGIMTGVWSNLKANNALARSIELAADSATKSQAGTWTFADIYLGFTGTNAVMDYDDGALYGSMLLNSQQNPEKFGSSYTALPSAPSASLSLSLASEPSPGDQWGLNLARNHDDSSEKYSIVLAERAATLTANVAQSEPVTAAATYLGPNSSAAYKSIYFGQGTPPDATPPSAVTGLAAEAVSDGIKAEWNAGTDDTALAGYVLQYKKSSDSKYSSRTLPAGVTTAYIRRLDSEATYDLRIFAYDKAGNLGPKSAPIQAVSGTRDDFNGQIYMIPVVIIPPPKPISTGGASGGGGCFIDLLGR